MVIFHSYVSLPEGISSVGFHVFTEHKKHRCSCRLSLSFRAPKSKESTINPLIPCRNKAVASWVTWFSIPQLPLTTKTCGENSCKSEPNKNSGNLCALHCAASNADCLPSADPADDQLAPGLPHPISTSATRASEKLCEAVGANLVRGV
jgi:hypothetical protein